MDKENPFTPPKAEVADLSSHRERPAWVWVILIFYVFGAGSSLLSYWLIFSDTLPIPTAQKEYFARLTVFDHALTFAILMINLTAAVQLFRLRKIAAKLFPVAFGLGLLVTAWHAAGKGWLTAIGNSGGLAGVAFGWVISVLICVYAWRLAKNGTLQ